MAEYTIELRSIIENDIPLFDFSYPFYDETKRREFEQDFIQHFYFREIGQETIPRFKHYLQDKFITVFPFYNELLQTATINYSILDNYKLVESMKRKTDSKQNLNGVSSTVGQFFSDNETNINNNGKLDTTGNATDTETTNTTEQFDSETNTATEGKTIETLDSTNKFLETPMGKVDNLNDGYLTDLRKINDTKQTTDNKEGMETVDSSKVGTISKDSEHNTTGTETTENETKSTSKDEQKSTQDNNTRTETKGQHNEEWELTRVGNIGIDTDSDMIEKHIKLQKTLTRIKEMFFDECEDLFMLVY